MPSVLSIRSCFVAAPGNVIVSADYKSAEIYTMGYLSNCEALIEAAGSDLHSRGVVNYFGGEKWAGFDDLKVPPKEWLDKHKALRIGSKAISFGIPYQRGAKAVARQIARDTKNAVTPTSDETQGYINGFYKIYPEMRLYVEVCGRCVEKSPFYIANPYGRRRRFTPLGDRSEIAAQKREATNYPIQSTVADTLNVALYNLSYWRTLYPGRAQYKILLAVHDAVLLEVPGKSVKAVVEEVLPACMTRGARVPAWTPLHGNWTSKPFTLDTEIEICTRWGEHPTADDLERAQVPSEYIEQYAA